MDSTSSKIEVAKNSLMLNSPLCASPSEERFTVENLTSIHVSLLQECGPFTLFVLSSWDNILGPILQHAWFGTGGQVAREDCVKYVVSRTLCGELLRDAPENIVDSKLFIFKEKDILCHSFIFTGRDKTGTNISSLSLVSPYMDFSNYLPLVELIEQRLKILISQLRILLAKDLSTAYKKFKAYLENFILTIIKLQNAGLSKEIQFSETALGTFSQDQPALFDKVFMLRAITSHLQTFGSTIVIGQSRERVNLMVSSLAMFLSPEERCTSRYAVEMQELPQHQDQYDPDIFVQGLLKDPSGSIWLPIKVIATSVYPTTLIDVDTFEVKQTCLYHEHCIKRKEFLDDMLALIWEDHEEAPDGPWPVMAVFHDVEDIGPLVQTFMHDLSLLPVIDEVRQSFVLSFLRILDRKALALIKYVEAKSSKGTKPLDSAAKRQLRHDLQLTTEADFYIVLARAEKHKQGMYMFFMGDPRPSVARVQAILESL